MELAGADVDRQVRDLQAAVEPEAVLRAGGFHHPVADLEDQAGLFGDGDEFAGGHHGAIAALPAQQRLDPREGAVIHPILRLVVQLQLMVAQGIAQLVGESEAVFLLLGHRFGKEDVVALTGALGHVSGRVSLLHQSEVIHAVAGKEADPDRGTAVQLVIGNLERGAKQPHQLAGEVLCQNFGGHLALPELGKEQGKFIPRDASLHQIVLRQLPEAVHHRLQQQIATGMAKGVVDRLEVVEIDQQQCPPLTIGRLQCALQNGVEAAAIVQATEIVVVGELLYVSGRLFLLGDVVEAADKVAEFPPLILHAAHHQAHREEVAILMQAALLTQPELLLGHGPTDILFQVIAIVGGAQLADGVANHLHLAKSGDAGKGVVHLEDDAVVIHHQQAVVGIEGHFGQAQGVVGSKALELDGGPLVLAAQEIQQGFRVTQRLVEQQGELAGRRAPGVVQRDADIGPGIEGQQTVCLGIAQRQIFHIDSLPVLEQLPAGARIHL